MHPPMQKLMLLGKRKDTGEMAEWSNAAVLKTVEGHTSGGSNPSFSAEILFRKKHKISKNSLNLGV